MHSLLKVLGLVPLALAAPLLNERAGNAIPGKYIVVYKQEVTSVAEATKGYSEGHPLADLKREQTYQLGKFKGFSAALSQDQVTALQADSRVAYIEQDGRASIKDFEIQSASTWGLGRISHHQKGSSIYVYDGSAGEGTCAYIVDTGIYAEHSQFGGRATFVADLTKTSGVDDHGHGTHVSGTIGSVDYGVAKKTKLYGIKVLDADGSGDWSTIIAGINLVVSDSKTRECPKGVVVNMSLGGDKQASVNDAANAAAEAGVFFAVAAGNENQDLAKTSPASASGVFPVGASDSSDKLADFSNWGATLAAIAPGVDINSTWIGSPYATNVISGTSMASPHVAGLGAYLLGLSGPLSPAALKSKILSLADSNKIALTSSASRARTPNRFVFNGQNTSN